MQAHALAAAFALVMTSLSSSACFIEPLAPIVPSSCIEDAGGGEEGGEGEDVTTCGGDRAFTELYNLSAEINEGARFIAQTFTPCAGGTLEAVRIHIQDNLELPLTVAIRAVDAGGQPGVSVLTSTTVSVAGAGRGPAPVSTIALPPIAVDAGTTYGIVVSYDTAGPPGPGQSAGVWLGSSDNPYPRGALFMSEIDGAPWQNLDANFDLNFDTVICETP